MIILTAEQAEAVRGGNADGTAALMPREIVGDLFVLPEAVLADQAHADRHSYLGALPTRDISDDEWITSEESL